MKRKTYQNTHGQIYRVKTKPKRKVMEKLLLSKRKALQAEPKA
jgi:hypothetical protein